MRWGAIAAIALLSATPAAATVMIPLSTQDLARTATHIVEGQVGTHRVLEQDGRLWTETTVRVTRAHKGALDIGAPVRVRQLGGETPRLGLRVVGTARFGTRERVLLFLRRVDNYFAIVGMCQGKYTVYRDAGGVARVSRDLSGASFARRSRTGRAVIVPSVRVIGAPEATLQELLLAIRPASRAGGAR